MFFFSEVLLSKFIRSDIDISGWHFLSPRHNAGKSLSNDMINDIRFYRKISDRSDRPSKILRCIEIFSKLPSAGICKNRCIYLLLLSKHLSNTPINTIAFLLLSYAARRLFSCFHSHSMRRNNVLRKYIIIYMT